MDFPSKEANPAARPLLRPRGGGAAADLGRRALRHMTLLLHPGSVEDRDERLDSTSNSRTALAGRPSFDMPLPEPMMHRPLAAGFAIEETHQNGVDTLMLSGELDARSAPALEAAVTRHFADGPGPIAVDLGGLEFIDSSGLWTILGAMRWCERQGRGFSLLPGPEPVQQVFEVTGLIDVLPFRSADTLG
jgi:anti-sigma B factor antagonist